jgi:dissimilatory sulfite reductase (desulfoviridin) alpha/beta subunit
MGLPPLLCKKNSYKLTGGPDMPEITIDADVCKKDGLCEMACTRAVFRQEEKGTFLPSVSFQKR